ncbi:MAG: PaaI family thioesterase, partial [Thermoguttaceae bacterium]|nr:PaaI family thioesterase [Thermoguttaceae bacterium]
STSFCRPAKPCGVITAKARELSRSRTSIVAEALIYDENEKLLCIARGRLFLLTKRAE